MAELENRKSFPMLPVSHWWALRKKFRQSIPGIVTNSYLATVLSMSADSARANVLPFLKSLGIIDSDGKPTDRAKLWREDGNYPEVCKAILKEVYPRELIDAVPDPVAEKEQARRWFAQHTGFGAAAASRMVALYTVLVEADPSKQPDAEKKLPIKKSSLKSVVASSAANKPHTRVAVDQKEAGEGRNAAREQFERGPDVNINLQIHISADASSDQIEQIFSSMSKHLYKRG